MFGVHGIYPRINFFMISPDEKLALFKFGPKTSPGLTTTSSNRSSSGKDYK